ncbi:MAG: hypothetical protein ACXAB7_04915 [Candidatus Kariarchaeaceae archaeon]|jgi:hypothetical protein
MIRCRTCGNLDVMEKYTQHTQGKDRYYCSKECKLAGESGNYVISGIIGIILAIIFLLGTSLHPISLLFSIPLFLLGIKKLVEGYRGAPNRIRKSFPNDFIPYYVSKKKIAKEDNDVPKIYSTELKKEILACCHQTARIGETYCVCGRSIPKALKLETEKD